MSSRDKDVTRTSAAHPVGTAPGGGGCSARWPSHPDSSPKSSDVLGNRRLRASDHGAEFPGRLTSCTASAI